MMKIQLTQGYETIVDSKYADEISKLKWRVFKTRNYVYARAWTPMINKQRKLVFLHRYVAEFVFGTGSTENLCVDHKNGDTLDNRIENLRLASVSQNTFNKKKLSNSNALYRGVSKTGYGRYKAFVQQTYIGTFDTPEQAAIAYDKHAWLIAREFSRPNFPEKIQWPR